MAHKKNNKKSKYPKYAILFSVLAALYLKVRDFSNYKYLTCGLGYTRCVNTAQFFIQLLLWMMIIFLIVFLLKFFIAAILKPSKNLKKKLVLKKANDQVTMKKIKKKLKKKQEKKEEVDKEPDEVEVVEEPEEVIRI